MLLELHINLSPVLSPDGLLRHLLHVMSTTIAISHRKTQSLVKKKKEFTDYGAMFVTFTSYVGHQVWCEAALPCVGFKILWAVNSK